MNRYSNQATELKILQEALLKTDARLKQEMSENKALYRSESSHLTMLSRLKEDIENFRSKAKDLGFKIGDSALISLEQDDTAYDINAVMDVIVQLVNSQKEEILSMKDVRKKLTCDQCGYSALYQSVLKKHVSMVHENIWEMRSVNLLKMFFSNERLYRLLSVRK